MYCTTQLPKNRTLTAKAKRKHYVRRTSSVILSMSLVSWPPCPDDFRPDKSRLKAWTESSFPSQMPNKPDRILYQIGQFILCSPDVLMHPAYYKKF